MLLPPTCGDLRSIHAGSGSAPDHSPGGVQRVLRAVARHYMNFKSVGSSPYRGVRGVTCGFRRVLCLGK